MLPATLEVRKQTDLLNDVADRSSEANRIPFARVSALHAHLAGARQQQSIDQLEDGCFSSTAGADEGQCLTGANGQRDIVENRRTSCEPVGNVAELDAFHLNTTIKDLSVAEGLGLRA